jgi:signal transduction histidine kinase/CheY-like chemotaxis protein/HPt (histidine-containing phosphotransfer) domain-containing protein
MRVFTARDTGAMTTAWSAVQDRTGTMHFGCDTVVSFDGDRWRSERMDPSYVIRGLAIGPNGRIWVAGVNQIGWFEPGEQGRLEYHSLMPRLPEGGGDLGDVWRVYAEGSDSAVFVAREKILRWDGTRFMSWDYPGMRILWSIRTPTSLYVHYPPLGLLRMGRDGPSVAVPASVLGTADIRWLDDSAQDWLLLTSEGFKTLRDGACTPLETDASSFMRANTPTSVARLNGGLLAIGTLQGGIAIVDRSEAVRRVFNLSAGLPANQIYSLYVDRDGALWAMGPSFIARLAIGSGVAVFGQRNGYPPGGCESVAEFAGATYVISHSDILRLSPDAESGGAGRFTTLGITSSRFYSLLSLPRGLAIGHFHGLGLWSPSGMRPMTLSDDIVFRTCVSQSAPGTLLASQYNRVLSVDLQTGRSSVVADSLPDYGDSLADEPSGRLWIGTQSRGLFVANPGSAQCTPAAPRFGPLPTTGPTLVTRAGATVVALARGAAYYLDLKADRFRRVAGFPGGNPSAVSNSDSRGAVWVALEPDAGGHSPRLGRISTTSDGAAWTPQSMEGLSNIGSLLRLQVVRSPDGDILWIAGSESLIRAGPQAQAAHPPPVRPLIRAWVRTDGGESGMMIGGTLPYSASGVHIEYSSFDYGMRESERYQTMLGGAENAWSPPTDSAEKDVLGLREGSYEFKVRLEADSGETGAPAVLRFNITPPWWRTAGAYAAYALAGSLALFGIIRLRVGSLKQRAQVLEETVRQRTEELERANAAKTEFVASMSHEIRNPMAGILGSARALSETPLQPEQQEHVSTLRNCASFLSSLVEDVLDFAAIEAGAYKTMRSAFSPREVLDAVVKMLAPKSGAARMDAAVDPALPDWIMGDAARIQQVIVNFAVNSLKFGGGRIRLSARPEGGHAVFAVADDGAGIPFEEQRNLFLRFSRLKSARNSAIPGTGLGLAVSRALAERMGGSVGVESAPGHGSTFFLRIPLEAGAKAESMSREFHAGGARALVVEDIGYNARSLGRMLEELGFEVAYAADGDEALSRLQATPFQAIFLDCGLPKVSGADVARRVRASEAEGMRALIVATTALSTAGDQEACLAAGMDAFIIKPVTPEKLRAVLSAPPGIGRAATPAPGPMSLAPGAPVLELGMIRHLTDGSLEGLDRELSGYVASLDEAMLAVAEAHMSGSRAALPSAAHRVLSHARMVGATSLAGSAADLQDLASAYTDSELAEQIGVLGQRAAALKKSLAPFRRCPPGPA